MQLNIISDLHVEFRPGQEIRYLDSLPLDGELTVIAGDLSCFGGVREWPAEHAFNYVCGRSKTVLYVPGNHEYYATLPIEVDHALHGLELQFPNLIVLRDNFVYEQDGLRFLGDTMWFPDKPGARIYRKLIADSSQIRGFFPWVFERNKAFVEFLQRELREGDVVVTHHLPSMLSVPPAYKRENTNYFFVCDMERLILERKPALWIHGHTHSNNDYMLGATRVVCNPVGYPSELGGREVDRMLIDVNSPSPASLFSGSTSDGCSAGQSCG